MPTHFNVAFRRNTAQDLVDYTAQDLVDYTDNHLQLGNGWMTWYSKGVRKEVATHAWDDLTRAYPNYTWKVVPQGPNPR